MDGPELMKLVHAADLHLDSPLRGLESYDGAPVDEVRGATRRALENLVDLCVDEEAKLLLIAGDLYDGDWRDYSTGLFFVEQMARLREAEVQVAWIRGNHDAASKITRHLATPSNVRELSAKSPETVDYEALGVAVHGVGYATREITENLAEKYPAPRSGALNVGLLHTAIDGRIGHAPYAPCSVEQLVARGYDYWALGHVHGREVLSEEPWVVFSGNLQGRHIRETGPKGASLLHVDGGRIASVEHRALDVVRWERLEIDVSRATGLDDALELAAGRMRAAVVAAEGRLLACRMILRGATEAHGALLADRERLLGELRGVGIDAGGVYIERVEVSTRPAIDPETLAGREDALGELFRSLEAIRANDDELDRLRREVLSGLEGLPNEVLQDAASSMPSLVEDAERLLLARFLGEGTAR